MTDQEIIEQLKRQNLELMEALADIIYITQNRDECSLDEFITSVENAASLIIESHMHETNEPF